jgi:hypothetical protein
MVGEPFYVVWLLRHRPDFFRPTSNGHKTAKKAAYNRFIVVMGKALQRIPPEEAMVSRQTLPGEGFLRKQLQRNQEIKTATGALVWILTADMLLCRGRFTLWGALVT